MRITISLLLTAILLGASGSQAQTVARQPATDYVNATWYSLFSLDPDGVLTSAPRICVESHGIETGPRDLREISNSPVQDSTTVPFLLAIGQYVVDAADCWAEAPDTSFSTLYVQGGILRHRAVGGDSISVALFELFQARPCAKAILRRCGAPVKGAPTIFVTGMVAKGPAGWPPIPLRRVSVAF